MFILAFGVFVSIGASARWYEFKGLYVGMSASEAKKLGLNKCEKGQVFDENCERNTSDTAFKSIGGAPIKSMGIVIEKGKVITMQLETSGAFWDDLIIAMKKNYGKPKKENPRSVMWDRGGAEFISLTVSKGICTILFAASEFDSDKAIRERSKKAAKDF
jgi:hypothetical protein